MTSSGVRIEGLRADRVAVPFRRPFATAAGTWLAREAWIVALHAPDGRTGIGEAVLEPAGGEAAAAALERLLREAAATVASIGTLPVRPELEAQGRPGQAFRAAVDAALLDLEGAPNAALAPGGDGVGVNATIPLLGPDASARAAIEAVEAGFRTLKLKAGTESDAESLRDRLRAVRAAVGPDVRLRLDVNGAWDRPTAAARLGALADLALEYVEQPLDARDLAGLAELRRLGLVPIAADEAVASVAAARDVLDVDAADFLVVKPGRVGGVNAARQVAEMAAARGVGVVISTLFETGVGIAAALAVAAGLGSGAAAAGRDHGLATADVLEHDLLRQALSVRDGRMRLPPAGAAGTNGAGGLGVALDEGAVARYRVTSIEARA